MSALPTELQKYRLLSEKEVAALTGRALQTLRNDRFRGRGIAYLKIGSRQVRYQLSDVLDFIDRSVRIETVPL